MDIAVEVRQGDDATTYKFFPLSGERFGSIPKGSLPDQVGKILRTFTEDEAIYEPYKPPGRIALWWNKFLLVFGHALTRESRHGDQDSSRQGRQ
jgi:hypothetical protein